MRFEGFGSSDFDLQHHQSNRPMFCGGYLLGEFKPMLLATSIPKRP